MVAHEGFADITNSIEMISFYPRGEFDTKFVDLRKLRDESHRYTRTEEEGLNKIVEGVVERILNNITLPNTLKIEIRTSSGDLEHIPGISYEKDSEVVAHLSDVEKISYNYLYPTSESKN